MLGTILLGLSMVQTATGAVGLAAYAMTQDAKRHREVWKELDRHHNRPLVASLTALPYLPGGPDDPGRERPAPSPADPDEDQTGADEPDEDAGLAVVERALVASIPTPGTEVAVRPVGVAAVRVDPLTAPLNQLRVWPLNDDTQPLIWAELNRQADTGQIETVRS